MTKEELLAMKQSMDQYFANANALSVNQNQVLAAYYSGRAEGIKETIDYLTTHK